MLETGMEGGPVEICLNGKLFFLKKECRDGNRSIAETEVSEGSDETVRLKFQRWRVNELRYENRRKMSTGTNAKKSVLVYSAKDEGESDMDRPSSYSTQQRT